MHTARLLGVFSLLAFFALFLFATPTPHAAHAAGPWYVSTAVGSSDSNDCSTPATPCASINGALAKPGFTDGDTIKVAVGTYYGTGNEVVLLNRSATLSGGWDSSFTSQSGMSTIDGQGTRRGVTVNSGATATIMFFRIQNGSSENGGGVANFSGTLTVTHSTVAENRADYFGGGIYNDSGRVMILDSSIRGNSAGVWYCCLPSGGAGIQNFGDMLVSNSTVYENYHIVTGSGGGAGIANYNVMTVTNTTVSSNGSNNFGAGIYNSNWLTQPNQFPNNS